MLDDRMTHARAVALMVVANVLWSTAGLVTRLLESAHSWEVTFWRSFFAAISMAGILAWSRRRAAWAAVRASGWPGIVSGLMFCTMFTCFMLAVTRTTVANTLVVNSLYPVFAAILGWVVLRTRLAAYTWVAIAAAVGGMAWMFASGLGPGLSGTLIAFAVPVAAAINVVTLRKWGRAVDLAPAVLLGGAPLGAGDAALRAAVPRDRAGPGVARRARRVPACASVHAAGDGKPQASAGGGCAAHAA